VLASVPNNKALITGKLTWFKLAIQLKSQYLVSYPDLNELKIILVSGYLVLTGAN